MALLALLRRGLRRRAQRDELADDKSIRVG